MKKIILIIITLVLLMNCENPDKEKPVINCEYDNPLEDISWLKDLKNSLKNCIVEISIFQAEYQNKKVFYTAPTDPAGNWIFNIDLMDCSGTIIKNYRIITEFSNDVTNHQVLYRCNKIE